MASSPRDRYDDIPEELVRVGAHRAPPNPGRRWARFGWAALATVLLIIGGLYGLSRVDPSFDFALPDFGPGGEPSASADPGEVVVPITDPALVPPELDLSISVLNGTETSGLQNTAADQIAAAGWPDPVRANATDRTATTTVVYYRSADFEGIARGLVELLGAGDVVLSDAFLGAPVTIVLGADYTPASG